jgi:DNA repair protein RadC
MQMYAIKPNVRFLDRKYREYPLTIHDLPSEEKPREKLIQSGPEALSIKELLAVVLVNGTTKENILDMSNRLIRDYGERSILAERDSNKLSQDMDIPLVKACQIVACGELGRRFYDRTESGFVTIRNAKDVFDYLQDMRNLPKEHLRGIYLNSHNRILRDEVISIGTVNSNMIHAREVFRPAIECNAAALILAHNHPSGESAPSKEDEDITKDLVEAGKILGISILDHVIITKDSFASVNANY